MEKETKLFNGILNNIKPTELECSIITKENIIEKLEDIYNSFPSRFIKKKEPKFIFNTNQIEHFTKKGYFKNGELTRLGNENISELLPYLRWDY